MASFGQSFAHQNTAEFSDIAGLIFAAPNQDQNTVWILTLMPPDPDAGLWAGTFGPGGTINWPSAIDPNPPGGGACLDDPFPAPVQTDPASFPAEPLDPDIALLPPGDGAPVQV